MTKAKEHSKVKSPAVAPAPVPVKITHLTPAERTARGKAARAQVPREGHAEWEPSSQRPDPIDLLEAQAQTRVAELIPIRYGRMLESPFAFYRGAAAIMASDLSTTAQSGLQVQVCGDAHVANFGGFASPERDLVLDINDFDETLPGPWEWDLKRLAASLEIVGRERDFKRAQRRSIVLAAVGEYRRAMREFSVMGNLTVWYSLLDFAAIRRRWGTEMRPRDIRGFEDTFAKARTQDNARAFEKLTRRVGDQLQIVSHPPLIVPIEELLPEDTVRSQVVEAVRHFIRVYRQSLPDARRHLLESFGYVHMARKVVGVGSVGTRTWIVLLLGRDDQDPLFLQIKEAQASVLEPYLGNSQYANHGQRVVEGQQLMQATSDILLGWLRMPIFIDGVAHDSYVRQLWDWKVGLDVETMSPAEVMLYGQMCGWTLARAHARSGDRIAIAAYLGKSDRFDQAIAEFAIVYADQNERDYEALVKAVKHGRVKAKAGL